MLIEQILCIVGILLIFRFFYEVFNRSDFGPPLFMKVEYPEDTKEDYELRKKFDLGGDYFLYKF